MTEPDQTPIPGTSAIILCGGKSTRMGWDKALLPFGHELLIQRMIRIFSSLVPRTVVVSRPDLKLPDIPADIKVLFDERPEHGPLEGLRVGLKYLEQNPVGENGTQVAFATSCDAPLLKTSLVRRMLGLIEQRQIVVPVDGKFKHPLTAVYRTNLWQKMDSMIQQNELRPRMLFDNADTRFVDTSFFVDIDPELESFRNLNRAEDYFAALAQAGLECPPEIKRQLLENRGDP